MVKIITRAIALQIAAAVAAAASPDSYFIRVYFDGAAARLAETSFVPYAASSEYALGEVGALYAERLRALGFRFDVLTDDPETKSLWDVELGRVVLPPAARVITSLGVGRAVVETPRGVNVAGGDDAVRLKPRALDLGALAAPRAPAKYQYHDEVAAIVAAVDRNRYERTVRDLAAFGTRYSYSLRCKDAADYLSAELAAAGLEVKRDRYFGLDMKRVAAANARALWAGGDGGLVCRTVNGGAFWEVVGRPFTTEIKAVSCFSADVAYVAGDDGYFARTYDGGASWDLQQLFDEDIDDISFITETTGWAVTTAGNVYRTDDGGDTWARTAALGEWLRGVSFADTDNGVVCGSAGYVAHTADGGHTWTAVGPSPPARLEAVTHRSPAEVYVVGEGGVAMRSADGGASWQTIELATEVYLRDVAFAAGDGIIVGGVGRGWRYGAGAGWRAERLPKYVLDSAAITGGGAWCGTGGGALLHAAAGGAWSDQAKNADPSSRFVWDNVWARAAGRGGAGTVLVSAHYDSYSKESSIDNPDTPAPGADDNATGTAAVAEFARACEGHEFRRDVIFACFSGEELGLLGSEHFAAAMASAGEPFLAVLNMDMLGYADKTPEDADVITDHASVWFAEYTRRAAADYVAGLGVARTVDDGMWRSDHKSFWNFGFTANLMIEDWPLSYEYYHSEDDTPDRLNFDVATLMARGTAASAASLATPTSMPVAETLDAVEVYPNPYKYGTHHGRVFFANLPPLSKIKIYTLAGELVSEGENGLDPIWALELDMKIKSLKAAGVYLYVIETADGDKTAGKLAVIN